MLLPPVRGGGGRAEPALAAPVSAWIQQQAFDSGAACEKERVFIYGLSTVRDDQASIDSLLIASLKDPKHDLDVLLSHPGALEYERERIRRMAKMAQAEPLHRPFLLNARCVSVTDPRLSR